ncbi:membrane protein [Psychromonas sp. PRT-SC03]|nr:membrane protein [Psychromonas sp. PRT-SC03]
MQDFSPWMSLAGVVLLGLSASLLLLFNAKIAGVSGILNALLPPYNKESKWKITFLIGMILSAFILSQWTFAFPDLQDKNIYWIAIAGVLVGFGTTLSNGCTSAHDIIGMGRFSKRSIIATLIFMTSAIIVVFIRHLLGAL